MSNTPTPNLDKLIEDWRDHHEECLHVMVRRVPQGYLAEVRLGAPGHSSPVFHPEDGETTLCGAGANPSQALAALDARCAPKPAERWAFWTYDSFPFTLGSKIVGPAANHEGYFHEEGYAYVFEPFAIVEGQAGAALKRDLDAIREEYSAACEKLRRDFLNDWRARLAREGVTHPSEARWAEEKA